MRASGESGGAGVDSGFFGVEVAGLSLDNSRPLLQSSENGLHRSEFFKSMPHCSGFPSKSDNTLGEGLACAPRHSCSASLCFGRSGHSVSDSDSTMQGDGVHKSSAVSHSLSSSSPMASAIISPLASKSRKQLLESATSTSCCVSSGFSGSAHFSQNPEDERLPREITSKLEFWSRVERSWNSSKAKVWSRAVVESAGLDSSH